MVVQTAEVGALQGVVAIGASTGGVEALSNLAAGLPPDVPYAYLMVLHVPRVGPASSTAAVRCRVPAQGGAALEPGHIYVGVPDSHLLVVDHRVLLSQGPTGNGHRPAINALFRSVALAFGPQAIGVLLSGVLDDGVLGLGVIRSRGGTTIGQSPRTRCSRRCRPTPRRPAWLIDSCRRRKSAPSSKSCRTERLRIPTWSATPRWSSRTASP